MRSSFICCLVILLMAFLPKSAINVDAELDYCVRQATQTAASLPATQPNLPRNILAGKTTWNYIGYKDWTSGFWPGTLWYIYEYTKDPKWLAKADSFSRELTLLAYQKAIDHDLGFQMYCSFGNGFRLTRNPAYKKILLATADTLATLFNPKVGTILSWPRSVPNMEWPQHNTIMDNMINLELLFWASKNGGGKRLYDIAVSHATTTMKNHFRSDYSSYHVVVYNRETGKKIKGVTHQGYADNSMWARGQSWAIYGYTMTYRETKDPKFLDFAQKVSDVYLGRLPNDLIPYWDFDAPDIPNAPKDASAAAVTASALLELSTLVKDKTKATFYRTKAGQMLEVLSSVQYQSRNVNSAFLLHSTGHKPNNSEVDASINYADYYYIEALLRLKKLKAGRAILANK
ncbi:glycoside hydrolase family 88 protein [Spirosoma foliorum]|uniref:Glycoside hydrolase family 88 protein n=1 Tax=Spirosoma foliorum TaxID=2710596 RepID=A0A7G5H0Q6_9BACT|nr:glycoside hydrolase family 88 protein [Spirosoma foliorum]QMW04698.1 glycoside hydrolase family 88 protein [Spirosoma foliorum]